jgi:hypothetical protein
LFYTQGGHGALFSEWEKLYKGRGKRDRGKRIEDRGKIQALTVLLILRGSYRAVRPGDCQSGKKRG